MPPSLDIISRTNVLHATHVLKRYRFDEALNAWVSRGANHPFTENTIADCGWEIFPSARAICARRIGEKEFQIFSLFPPAAMKLNCYGSHPVGTANIRRFAYLRNSNAYISHRPMFHENKGGPYLEGEASTLLDRNVNAITWTGDGRNIVYCRIADNTYQLVAYNLGDDDFSVLLEFPKSETNPVLASDLTDGVYLVTEENTIRKFRLPLTASAIRLESLAAIPVIYRTGGSEIINLFEIKSGELRLFETEPDGTEYETVLKVEPTMKDPNAAK